MEKSKVKHLTKEDIIKNGSIFTPEFLVKIVKKYISDYIDDNTVIVDFGCGYGAFISQFLKYNCKKIATDIDEKSVDIVKQNYPEIDARLDNSLLNVKRSLYANDKENLVVIGNPPYNDITSQYKKGEKGTNNCDEDIKSRDLGISFLRMFNKIEAQYICVLHPLSYLSKKTNFLSLKEFANNYSLLKGLIFSSQLFESIEKSNAEFPVVIALYQRDKNGMKYDDILKFQFDIYGPEHIGEKYILNNFRTIDGIVDKYPTKDKKDTDLQFYTLRDMNALKRNKTFLTGACANGIKVTKENLYQYVWLDLLKRHFVSDEMFLYGNLSPMIPRNLNALKDELIGYGLNEIPIVKEWFKENDYEFYWNNKNNSYNRYKFKDMCQIDYLKK